MLRKLILLLSLFLYWQASYSQTYVDSLLYHPTQDQESIQQVFNMGDFIGMFIGYGSTLSGWHSWAHFDTEKINMNRIGGISLSHAPLFYETFHYNDSILLRYLWDYDFCLHASYHSKTNLRIESNNCPVRGGELNLMEGFLYQGVPNIPFYNYYNTGLPDYGYFQIDSTWGIADTFRFPSYFTDSSGFPRTIIKDEKDQIVALADEIKINGVNHLQFIRLDNNGWLIKDTSLIDLSQLPYTTSARGPFYNKFLISKNGLVYLSVRHRDVQSFFIFNESFQIKGKALTIPLNSPCQKRYVLGLSPSPSHPLDYLSLQPMKDGSFLVLSNWEIHTFQQNMNHKSKSSIWKFDSLGTHLWSNCIPVNSFHHYIQLRYAFEVNDSTYGVIGTEYENIHNGTDNNPARTRVLYFNKNGDPGKALTSESEVDESPVIIFPNPASHTLKIEANHEEFKDLNVLDPLGRTVYFQPVRPSMTIDLSGWARGIYYLNFIGETGHYIVKTVLVVD